MQVAKTGSRATNDPSKTIVSLGFTFIRIDIVILGEERHSGGKICEPTGVANLDGIHKGCGNNAAIGAGELELILPIKDLVSLLVDLLGDAKKSNVDAPAVDVTTIELSIMTQLPKALFDYTYN